MKSCEYFETLASTWLDGPLERSEQLECLDHLVRCVGCRSFYVDARALDGLVASIRTPSEVAPPSPEVWKRIEWAMRKERKRSFRGGAPAWVLRAAALLVLAAGLAVAVWIGAADAPPLADEVEVQVGSSTDMTDARFVELAKELLQSDRRYHAAMYQIMDQVLRETTPVREASSEGLVERLDEGAGGERVESPGRLPA